MKLFLGLAASFAFVQAALLTLHACTSSTAEAKPWEPPRPCAQLRAGWAVYSMGWFEAGHQNHSREVFMLQAPDGRQWIGVTGASLEEWQISDGKNTINHEE